MMHMCLHICSRYKNAGGDAYLQTNELADLIKKMYESFTSSQEKLLAARVKPTTSDMQVQVEPPVEKEEVPVEDIKTPRPIRLAATSFYSTYMRMSVKQCVIIRLKFQLIIVPPHLYFLKYIHILSYSSIVLDISGIIVLQKWS